MRNIIIVSAVCMVSIVSLFSGCVNEQKELAQFSILSFEVEPSIINKGDSANLSWVVLAATSVTIDNGVGGVALTGHRIVFPTQTTTYILTASNATMTKSATVTVTVSSPANESHETSEISIVSFDVTPSVIDVGASANLSWAVTGATSVSIDNGIGNVALSGHRTVIPSQTTTYTLTASSPSTSKIATVQVFVRSEQPVLPQQTPNIAFTTDSIQNKMTVAASDANIKWSDIVVTLNPSTNYHFQVWYNGGTTQASIQDATDNSAMPAGTTVTAGDYIQLTTTSTPGNNVLVTLRYVPTNSLLGTWTINV
jgi:hypothetical protein